MGGATIDHTQADKSQYWMGIEPPEYGLRPLSSRGFKGSFRDSTMIHTRAPSLQLSCSGCMNKKIYSISYFPVVS